MAKILIIRLQSNINNDSTKLTCFYDSLNKELIEKGNDVLWLNTIQEIYITKYEKLKFKRWINSWIDQIIKFKPDIIFTFNNRIFEDIIKVTNCPIVLFEADLINYFVKTDLIKKYKERYYIVTFFKNEIPVYKSLGFYENRIILCHPATSIKYENKEKINNISFIGTFFPQVNYTLKKQILSYKNNNFYNMMLEFWNKHNYEYKTLCDKYLPNNNFSNFDYFKIFDSRVFILQSLLDLGLKLYGVEWDNLQPQLINILSAFDTTPVYSLEHNQNTYNSSIINLSISHPQCKGYGFPWRIYDIMASSGVLVSSYSSALESFTKDFVNIPMFKSPYDARSLCKKMLEEKNLRQDIIEASNDFIEKHGRWESNLQILEQFLNIKILNNINKKGKVYFIDYNFNLSFISLLKRNIKRQILEFLICTKIINT